MDFLIWIDKMGVTEVAELLGITKPSIYQWRTVSTAPSPIMAYRIIELSNGLLDFNDIYRPYVMSKLQAEDPNQTKFKFLS